MVGTLSRLRYIAPSRSRAQNTVIAPKSPQRTFGFDGAIGALAKDTMMEQTNNQISAASAAASGDVFAAARWLDALWNSSARAVSPDEIEWQCNTWGSGRGRCDWIDTANFAVVIAAFDLQSWSNHDSRDELVVLVPFDRFSRVAGMIERLGEEAEGWAWFDEELEDDEADQVAVAAGVLGMAPAALAGNEALLKALRIR